MILAEMALQSHEVPVAPHEAIYDASGILDELFAPEQEPTAQLLLSQQDARPTDEFFCVEFGGPALAKLLNIPMPPNGHVPLAAIKGLHVDDRYTALDAREIFEGFVGGFEGHELSVPTQDEMPDLAYVNSLTIFMIVTCLEPERLRRAYAQLHHKQSGALIPNFELRADVVRTVQEAEEVPMHAAALVRAAKRFFTYQRNYPFESERRAVTLPTVIGDYPITVNHLLKSTGN